MRDTSTHARRLQRTVIVGFVVLVIGLAALGILVFGRMTELDLAREWVEHTVRVLDQLNKSEDVLTSAEGAQRGYLLTGNAGFLATLDTDDRRLTQLLATLRQLTRDNLGQQERIVRIVDDRRDGLGTRRRDHDAELFAELAGQRERRGFVLLHVTTG